MWRPAAAAALALLAAAAVPSVAGNVASPIQKVALLLADLRGELSRQGEAEAATYNKFACFCQDETARLGSAISAGQTGKDTLEADLSASLLARDEADSLTAQEVQAIGALRREISGLTEQRHEGLLRYEGAEVDLTAAIQGVDAAVRALRAAKTSTSLAELRPLAPAIERALLLAEALPTAPHLSVTRPAAALLSLERHGGQVAARHAQRLGHERHAAVPTTAYEFHADDLLATLEDLKVRFRAKRDELDRQETADREAFTSVVQGKEASIKESEGRLQAHTQSKAAKTQRIAEISTDLTTTSAQLLEDQGVLAELSGQCHKKATLWDERSQARANELATLTQAAALVESLQASANATLLLQQPKRSAVQAGLAERSRPAGGSRAAVAAGAEPYAFVQTGRAHRTHVQGRGTKLGRRLRVTLALRQKAAAAHSVVLLQLARRVAEDPLGKIKTMIQQLIERLLKEATAEANHKGWCDREVALAEQTRGQQAESIAELNSKLEVSEARRAQLASLISTLDGGISEVNATLSKSGEVRAQEKRDSEVAIAAATEGKKAVAEAIDVLTKYYKTAANSGAVLAQRADDTRSAVKARSLIELEEVPDAGFDGAYLGAQGAKEGILGMLEVIQSDFESTIARTQEAERVAQQDFYELEKSLGAALAEKEVGKEEREKALREADAEDDEYRQNLAGSQARLDKALGELEALQSACFGGGTTAAERQMQRKEEIEALKQGLCILEQHGLDGVEGC